MPSDFKTSKYLKKSNRGISSLDLSYLFDIDDNEFKQFFSLDASLTLEQRNNQNYEKHYDFIYSGCSETTGGFLVNTSDNHLFNYSEIQSTIWGDIVGASIGVTESLNMSFGGASAMGIVNNLIRQIRVYEPPKHILILLPNLDSRITFVKDPSRLISSSENQELVNDITGIGEHENNYSKKPHIVEEIFTKRWATYLNTQSVILLEEVCAARGVNLIYSTWSNSTDIVITAANALASSGDYPLPFPNYVPSDYVKSSGAGSYATRSFPADCHVNSSNYQYWHKGSDGAHMGMHAHLHIAETFKRELYNRGILSNL